MPVGRQRNAEISGCVARATNAGRLRFILPPTSSASAASIGGLARAKSSAYTDRREAAVRESLSVDDAVSLLVSLPDPANLSLMRDPGGRLVPVIDRGILRRQKCLSPRRSRSKAPGGPPGGTLRPRPPSPMWTGQ